MRHVCVLGVLALLGCPDKDTGDSDTSGTDPDTVGTGGDTDGGTELERLEACGSGVDEDTDGFVDCADSDCDPFCADATCLADALVLPVSRDVTSVTDLTTNSARGNDCTPREVPHDLIVVRLEDNDALLITLRGDGEVIPVDACDTLGRCDVAVPSGSVFYPDAAGTQAFAVYPQDVSSFGYDLERVPWEDCGNRVDDNGDGLVDCEDAVGCGDASLCSDTCPEPGTGTVATVDVAANWQDTSQFLAGDSCEVGADNSPDVVIAVDALAGQHIRVAEESAADLVVNITQGQGQCSGRAANGVCVASTSEDVLDYTVLSDDRYYVVVSVDASAPLTPLDLSVSVSDPEDCATLVDDDDDGLAACADDDCDGIGECALECDSPALPVVASGDSWQADFAAETSFTTDGGCIAEAGTDLRFTVSPEPGDSLRVIAQGSAQTVLNVTEDAGLCSSLLSSNTCVFSAMEADNAGLSVFEIPLATDVPTHVHASTQALADDGEYDLRAGVVRQGECGMEVAASGGEESYRLAGSGFQSDWPDELPAAIGAGCVDTPDGTADAAFTVSLAHGDTVIVQDLTGRFGIDHAVNILDGVCSVASTCVYGQDDPIGPGLPEIYSFTRDEPGSVGDKRYTVQVTTAAGVDAPYDFTVSVLRD